MSIIFLTSAISDNLINSPFHQSYLLTEKNIIFIYANLAVFNFTPGPIVDVSVILFKY